MAKRRDGRRGGACSAMFTAQPWQQSVSDWSSVGCGERTRRRRRLRRRRSLHGRRGPRLESLLRDHIRRRRQERHLPGWCTIGGTSLASPTHRLGVRARRWSARREVPTRPGRSMKTPEEIPGLAPRRRPKGRTANAGKPFETETGLSACTASEEAAASCSSQLICLAGTGYDGPTGVGTPNGIAAFQPPAGGGSEEPTEEKGKSGEARAKPWIRRRQRVRRLLRLQHRRLLRQPAQATATADRPAVGPAVRTRPHSEGPHRPEHEPAEDLHSSHSPSRSTSPRACACRWPRGFAHADTRAGRRCRTRSRSPRSADATAGTSADTGC